MIETQNDEKILVFYITLQTLTASFSHIHLLRFTYSLQVSLSCFSCFTFSLLLHNLVASYRKHAYLEQVQRSFYFNLTYQKIFAQTILRKKENVILLKITSAWIVKRFVPHYQRPNGSEIERPGIFVYELKKSSGRRQDRVSFEGSRDGRCTPRKAPTVTGTIGAFRRFSDLSAQLYRYHKGQFGIQLQRCQIRRSKQSNCKTFKRFGRCAVRKAFIRKVLS